MGALVSEVGHASARRARPTPLRFAGRGTLFVVVVLLLAFLTGCATPGHPAARLYYQGRYDAAQEAVREEATNRQSEDVVLNNLRLGLASLAAGELDQAQRALMRAYEYLASGGVNRLDRTVASTLIYEGIKVWTGEPYEQAMAYYYLSVLYMLKGDWENARAAARNSLFALREFRKQPGAKPGQAYRAVKSEFALGYLLTAANYVLMGRGAAAERLFDKVRELRPQLDPLVDVLESGDYNTLLIVDYGRGPRKVAYGPNNALVRFVPDGRYIPVPRLEITVDGSPVRAAGRRPVVDLWTLSQFPKWWSLESVRRAKGAVGNVLAYGGLRAAMLGLLAEGEHDEAVLIGGLAALAAGALLKASAQADLRYLAMLPRSVYLVPLKLEEGAHQVKIYFTQPGGYARTFHGIRPGETGAPEVYYLRVHR